MKRSLFGVGVTAAVLAVAYAVFGQRRVLNWGATPEEVDAALPGDDLVPDGGLQSTRAITIDVPPDRVWPWLVQMGTRPRAGLYTYDWIERLLDIDIENVDHIMPEFQHLDAGEFFPLGKKGAGLRVKDVQPGRAIVLQFEPELSSWAFVLDGDASGKTRLLSRNRVQGSGPLFALWALIIGPATLVMERRMLLGIKERAEGSAGVESEVTAEAAGTNS